MDAGAPVEFDIRVPVEPAGLIANVRFACALGLPELRDFEYGRDETLTIIANGPSAQSAPLAGVTLALNGALRLFTDRGLAPTFWACCDPQELVADFLKDAPEETVYLVASKCHPSVFKALVGRKVLLWHVHDEATRDLLWDRSPVARGVSITICAFELMARMGYRRFATWGWDGCTMGGIQHAVGQAETVAQLTIQIGDPVTQQFTTSPAWALEAEDATRALRGFPFPVTVHGGGFMGEMLKLYLSPHFVTDTP